MNYCAFDLETFAIDVDPNAQGRPPLGISCAATVVELAAQPRTWWQGQEETEDPAPEPLTRESALEMLDYLEYCQTNGYPVLTWNGAGFDLKVLAEETGEWKRCAELALGSVDMMFQFFCVKGYPLSMQAAADGQGLPGKTEGMSGALAPEMWQNGTTEDRWKVLEYVGQDATTTLALAEVVERKRGISWVSKKGKANYCKIDRWLTVRECLALPLPDTSWMSAPIPRSQFVGWALEALGEIQAAKAAEPENQPETVDDGPPLFIPGLDY